MKVYIKKTDGTGKRIFKQLLLGGIIGAVIGFIFGFGAGYFDISNNNFPFSLDDVTSVISWIARVGAVLSLITGLYYIVIVLKYYKRYEQLEDEESEELYRMMNKKHSYAVVYAGITYVLAFVSITLTYRVSLGSDSAELHFPFIDFLILICGGILHAYSLKVYKRIRNIDIPLLPTLKELKDNILQMDEAELEANYKMSFDIIMSLSGQILPDIYIILAFISFVFQKIELTGILITAFIHLYILAKNFKLAKDYYK